jgi:hypothetical protein
LLGIYSVKSRTAIEESR